jgi:N-acetylmuramic acid 6-phosphate (MurNAc-6-P) etherase
VAVVMLKDGLPVHQAEDQLDAAEGSVHAALGAWFADPPNNRPTA